MQKLQSSYHIFYWLNRHKSFIRLEDETTTGQQNKMVDDVIDTVAFNNEQGHRARKLFAAVVLAALDDAIAEGKAYGNGPEQIAGWARSRDGHEVLSCAGIDPSERVVEGLMEFVARGVRTSVALSREESGRRLAAHQSKAA